MFPSFVCPQRCLPAVHIWKLRFLVERLMWTWIYTVAFWEEMKLMQLVGEEQPSLSSLFPKWKLRSGEIRVGPGYVKWLLSSLKWASSSVCDAWNIFINLSLSSYIQLVEHIQRPWPCARYSPHTAPKGSYIHVIDEANESLRKEVTCLNPVASTYLMVWSRAWVSLLNHPAPLLVLQNGVSGFEETAVILKAISDWLKVHLSLDRSGSSGFFLVHSQSILTLEWTDPQSFEFLFFFVIALSRNVFAGQRRGLRSLRRTQCGDVGKPGKAPQLWLEEIQAGCFPLVWNRGMFTKKNLTL